MFGDDLLHIPAFAWYANSTIALAAREWTTLFARPEDAFRHVHMSAAINWEDLHEAWLNMPRRKRFGL